MENDIFSTKTRLFVDMDGTLAVFTPAKALETLYEPGYFRNLEPMPNVLAAIRELIAAHPTIDVHILSAVLSDSAYALEEKNAWLDQYLPEIDAEHRIFMPCGEDKKAYIPGGIRPDDYLLDDYTKNLIDWQPPARGIKLMNGINGTRGTWQHDKVFADMKSSALLADIEKIVKSENNPQIHEHSTNISVDGHLGTWYTIGKQTVNGNDYFLLEHEEFGDEAAAVIVDRNGHCVIEDVYNGFDDLADYFDEIRESAQFAGVSVETYWNNKETPPAGRTLEIYQIPDDIKTRGIRYEPLASLQSRQITPSLDMYKLVYSGSLEAGKDLNDVWMQFNTDFPADYAGRSLSVSDIIVIGYQGEYTANYVDSTGFVELPEFAKEVSILEQYVNNTDERARSIAAELGRGLEVLVHDADPYVRQAVAKRGHGLEILVHDADPYVRQAVAKQGYGLEIFVHDTDSYVRQAVAAQGYGLNILIRDSTAEVRCEVAHQGYGLLRLAKDENASVRRAVYEARDSKRFNQPTAVSQIEPGGWEPGLEP